MNSVFYICMDTVVSYNLTVYMLVQYTSNYIQYQVDMNEHKTIYYPLSFKIQVFIGFENLSHYISIYGAH